MAEFSARYLKEQQELGRLSKLVYTQPKSTDSRLRKLIDRVRHLGEAGLLASALYVQAACLRRDQRHSEAFDTLASVLALAASIGNQELAYNALLLQAYILEDQGLSVASLNHLEAAMELPYAPSPEQRAKSRGLAGTLLTRLGRKAEGRQALKESAYMAGVGEDYTLIRRLAYIWHLCDDLQEPEEAASEYDRIQRWTSRKRLDSHTRLSLLCTELAIAAKLGLDGKRMGALTRAVLRTPEALGHFAVGWALLICLEAQVARQQHEQALALLELGSPHYPSLDWRDKLRWLQARAQCEATGGHHEAAQATLAQASAVLAAHDQPNGVTGDMAQALTRTLEVRLSLARSHEDAQRLRHQLAVRDAASRETAGRRHSMLSELYQGAGLSAQAQSIDLDPLGFFLVYQPFLCLKTMKIKGVEALIRLQHPGKGALLPGEFIPQLDASGEIEMVGKWVIQSGCKQLIDWAGQHPDITVAVNVAASQLASGQLADFIENSFQSLPFVHRRLELEITETVASNDKGVIASELDRLSRLGIGISIDDFGTGYSNFARLIDISPSKVKIDKSLIDKICMDQRAQQAVASLILAAHGMSMTVTAEGVESAGQLRLLKTLGCDLAQGYLIARPSRASHLEDLFSLGREHWVSLLG